MSFVAVVPICLDDRQALLGQLCRCVERTLHVEVRLRVPWFDPDLAFDTARGQYNAPMLLGKLMGDPCEDDHRVLGVTSLDIFSPALMYVFGEAQLNGRVALVSIERLRNEAYGLPANDALLSERLEKEAIHELGHTYGLVHCRNAACVMHASTYAEQIDFKSAQFCSPCLASVASRTK
jgi:archaemetzincin